MTRQRPARPKGRPKTIDRRGTLEAAMLGWWSEGPGGLSLNEACRRAEVSKPAVYREFGGEDGLMDAALERYRSVAVEPLLAVVARTDATYADCLEALADLVTTDFGLPAGCLFTKMRLDRQRLGPMTSKRLEAIIAERLAAFTDLVRRGRAAGTAHAHLSPAKAARYIDAQLTGALVHLAGGEPRRVVRAQLKLALSVLVRGAF
jgi:AcrR family transcriptional regulator